MASDSCRGGQLKNQKSIPFRVFALFVCLALGGAILTACSSSSSSGPSTSTDNPYDANLTYWFWGNLDAPGSTTWLAAVAAEWTKLHPNVHITIVPQSTDTVIGNFTLAAKTKTGPDLATQWATLPVLSAAWEGASVPLGDYVSSSVLDNLHNTQENVYDGQLWGMPDYLLGLPFVINRNLFKKAGLPATVPTTWADLLADCATLNAAGITPIGAGNKDGYLGPWLLSMVGAQALNSPQQFKEIMLGKIPFSSSPIAKFYTAFEQLMTAKCFNTNVGSITLDQGLQLFPENKVAMEWAPDGEVISWASTMGDAAIGVGRTPKWGNGAMSSWYDVTQSSSELITSWSPQKAAAAAFLEFMHTPANALLFYKDTGVFPAEKNFPVSAITNPLSKALYKLDTTGQQAWIENYVPSQVDGDADGVAGQIITSGGSPAKAAALWDQVISEWKVEQPVQYADYLKFAAQ
jgi:raffinose/stachyose/melibiose transport system substrate-binding protein